ncbi:MAG: hypothetical protein R3E79_34360 [Caldilineaceae bacterium]
MTTNRIAPPAHAQTQPHRQGSFLVRTYLCARLGGDGAGNGAQVRWGKRTNGVASATDRLTENSNTHRATE